ncbi:MAG: S41 family peptidase [Candidatus Dojkabacteria bacterium]|nr:S41 family peptidase [Candidatus Dojkabacteria bacterium]
MSKIYLSKLVLVIVLLVTLFLGVVLGLIISNISSFNVYNVLQNQQNQFKSSNLNFKNVNVSTINGQVNLNVINQLLSLINENYIYDLPSFRLIEENIAKGLVSAFNDEYLIYLTKEENEAYEASLNPDFEGIGVRLHYNGEYTEVYEVFSQSPAYNAGILAGDIIISVDNENMYSKTPAYVASKIRGPQGSVVLIEVLRGKENKKFNIQREKIDVENVYYSNLGNNIYHITINQFLDESPFQFNESWDKLVNNVSAGSPKGIVLDLRNNNGGFVYSARYVIDEFIKKDSIILLEQKKNSELKTYKTVRDGKFENIPLVVLVNQNTASAAEIFALAIRDNSRGILVGTSTLGKGIEQQKFDNLINGASIIIPFQKWLSPNGTNVNKSNPVKPDYIVDLDKQKFYKDKYDSQLQFAVQYLLQNI